ncbi:Rid family hydrolase [Arthrobacter sp.]|uniref:RidA family protein n=1 Tax=Arthrobacter sp. TaxID=1667 RepID=UPI003394398F
MGPFSQAVIARGFVFTTGQIPLIAGTDDRPADYEGKVRQVLTNLRTVLEGAGSSLDHVVNATVYISDQNHDEEYRRIYAEVFGSRAPALTSICVGIWDFSFEIQCIAVMKEGGSS